MTDMPPVEPPLDEQAAFSGPHVLLAEVQLKQLRNEGWRLHHSGWLPQRGERVASARAHFWPGVVEDIETRYLFTSTRHQILVRWPAPELPNGFVSAYHPHLILPLDSWRNIVGDRIADFVPAPAARAVAQ